MLRLFGCKLIRIGAVFRRKHMHGKAAAFYLAADLFRVIIAHMIQPHMRRSTPQLDAFEADALLCIEEIIQRIVHIMDVHARHLFAAQFWCRHIISSFQFSKNGSKALKLRISAAAGSSK